MSVDEFVEPEPMREEYVTVCCNCPSIKYNGVFYDIGKNSYIALINRLWEEKQQRVSHGLCKICVKEYED